MALLEKDQRHHCEHWNRTITFITNDFRLVRMKSYFPNNFLEGQFYEYINIKTNGQYPDVPLVIATGTFISVHARSKKSIVQEEEMSF